MIDDDAQDDLRDRPLSFHFHVKDNDLLAVLDLPKVGRKQERARQSIITEALIAHAAGGSQSVSYSRAHDYYAGTRRYYGTAFTHASIVGTVDALAGLGLLENNIAPRQWQSQEGRQSTFRAAPKLLEALPAKEVAKRAEHAVHELIRLKDADKQLIDYRDTDRTCEMRRRQEEGNEATRSIRIDVTSPDAQLDGPLLRLPDKQVLHMGQVDLYRVFNGDWRHGGRLYWTFWQQLPKDVRKTLLIDGEAVAEPDHSQLHPRLLYMLAGKTLEGDAYTLAGWDRPLCKVAFNILLNANDSRGALGAVAKEIGGHGAYQKACQLIEALKIRHAPVAEHFHTGRGLVLQNVDGDMAEFTLRRLRKQGIVALPVHDSFIVQKRHEDAAKEAMDAALTVAHRHPAFPKQIQVTVPKTSYIWDGGGVTVAGVVPPPPVPSLPLASFGIKRPSQLALFDALPVDPLSDSIVFGCKVRTARNTLGLTRDQAAARCGLSGPGLTNIELARFPASLRTRRRITEALNVKAVS